MVRVSLVTCVWQRRELTRAFWTWATRLQRRWAETHGIELSLVAAASDIDDAKLAESFGVDVVWHDNVPLGAKFNAALTHSRRLDPAMVLIMGSDDLGCDRVSDALGDAVLADRSVGFKDLYYADLPRGRVRYLSGYRIKSRWTEPFGPGTLHRRDVLEQLRWRLWDGTRHHAMDCSRFATLKANGAMPELLHLRELDGVLIDVKTEVNMWPFDRTQKQPVLSQDEGLAVWDRLPADVRDLVPWPAPAVA